MQITVRPISASLIRDTDTFTRMDPYCLVFIGNQRQKTRTCNEGGKQPEWRDTLSFTLSGPASMGVQVWDEDPLTDDLVGQGFVDLSSYLSNPGASRNENVVLMFNGRKAGMVNIMIQVQGGMGMGMNMGMGGMNMNMGMGMGGMGGGGWGNQQMGGMGMGGGWGNPPMGGMGGGYGGGYGGSGWGTGW